MADGTAKQGELFGDEPGARDSVQVSARCAIRTQDGHRLVLVSGVVLAHFSVGDRMSEAHAMVSIVEQGFATQVETARAFGVATRTVRRFQHRCEQGGLAALGRRGGYPAGRPRLAPARTRVVEKMKSVGESNRAIAARVGVTEKAVRKLLRRLGWRLAVPEQRLLPLTPVAGADPNLSASPTLGPATAAPPAVAEPSAASAPPLPQPAQILAPEAVAVPGTALAGADPNLSAPPTGEEPLPVSFDTDPAHRTRDRLLARLGLLDDAAPMFRAGTRVPHAGVLLAIPALLETGVLDCAREVYGDLAPAFYGLRTSIVALLLLALVRIKRPEALKEHAPDDLGRLLGLDRAPEVKTVRRKLLRLGSAGRAAAFGRALALRRVAAHGAAMGFLYADGHVRVYHGKHVLPKAHVPQMHAAVAATTDYWVNDAKGEPLFVVTAQANAALTKMLPVILDEVRALLGERRVTIVFDRGGWSPVLFEKILARGFDILTYRKGKSRRVPVRSFKTREATIDGEKVSYSLADQGIRLLRGRLRLRQVTRRMDNGHQTPIVTSRRDLPDVEVAYRMFARWKEENFFKYLGEEYALDALADHTVEDDDPERDVPNPRLKAISAQIREQAEIMRQLGHKAHALNDPAQFRRSLRAFRRDHPDDAGDLWKAIRRHAALQAQRKKMPDRVPVRDVVKAPVVKLATERKHLTNVLKMVAYQAETDLVRRIAPHYRRAEDEGRTLVQTALNSAADIAVNGNELLITLAPLSSPHRSRAVAELCAELNRKPVRFPGSNLRMRFAVADPA